MSSEPKLLFITKERYNYGSPTRAYGLYNSCLFVSKALEKIRIKSKVIQVVDNNGIDAEVSEYKPSICFIEALWVNPSKFEVLSQLHPNIEWVVRLHSMIPFLSNEGMAFEWINGYINLRKRGIKISLSCNNKKLYDYLKPIYKYVSFTPNIYVGDDTEPTRFFNYTENNTINIGCFGALRPLKNTTQQAMLATKFANDLNKKLKFHINVSEHEQNTAGPILKNLREIFKQTNHTLVEHPWYEHADFLQLVRSMDFGMQMSFSETFNITSADFVHCGIPVVVSNEIDFVHDSLRSDVHDDRRILNCMKNAFYKSNFDNRTMHTNTRTTEENSGLLSHHNRMALRSWIYYLGF